VVSTLQVGQQEDAFLLGSRLPHDRAAVDRLSLTGGFAGRAIGQEIRARERSGMRPVGIQRVHQRRTFLNDPHPGVAMAMNPPLMALGQAKPPLQIEIVLDPFIQAIRQSVDTVNYTPIRRSTRHTADGSYFDA
jgi:hypothetical protein